MNVMEIIQIESLEYLKENNYPEDKECVMDKDEFLDTFEDGSVIGGGYTYLSFLQDEIFEKEERRILNKLHELGCEIDTTNNVIYFTEEFCVNYAKEYFLALKEKINSLTPEDYALVKTAEELEDLKKLLAFYEVEITSHSLGAYLSNFEELTKRRFIPFNDYNNDLKEVNKKPFKIVSIMKGY